MNFKDLLAGTLFSMAMMSVSVEASNMKMPEIHMDVIERLYDNGQGLKKNDSTLAFNRRVWANQCAEAKYDHDFLRNLLEYEKDPSNIDKAKKVLEGAKHIINELKLLEAPFLEDYEIEFMKKSITEMGSSLNKGQSDVGEVLNIDNLTDVSVALQIALPQYYKRVWHEKTGIPLNAIKTNY